MTTPMREINNGTSLVRFLLPFHITISYKHKTAPWEQSSVKKLYS